VDFIFLKIYYMYRLFDIYDHKYRNTFYLNLKTMYRFLILGFLQFYTMYTGKPFRPVWLNGV